MELADIITPELTTLVAQALVALIGSLVTAFLAAGLRFIQTKTNAEQFAYIQHAAAVAVNAAEQLGLAGYIEDKKAVALGMASRELAKKGIRISPEALDTAIEAAVMEAFNYEKVNAQTATVEADIAPPDFGSQYMGSVARPPIGFDTTGL